MFVVYSFDWLFLGTLWSHFHLISISGKITGSEHHSYFYCLLRGRTQREAVNGHHKLLVLVSLIYSFFSPTVRVLASELSLWPFANSKFLRCSSNCTCRFLGREILLSSLWHDSYFSSEHKVFQSPFSKETCQKTVQHTEPGNVPRSVSGAQLEIWWVG